MNESYERLNLDIIFHLFAKIDYYPSRKNKFRSFYEFAARQNKFL